MSTWLFSVDDGAAPLVITQHVEIPSINRERRLHTELKSNVNVCSFRCRFDAALWAYLISSTSIQIAITKDSAAYFTGYVSPNFETKIRDGQKYIEMRAEDYSLKKLGQTIGAPLVCPGFAVCDPAAPAASLVHVIAAAAGVTVSPLVPTISTVVPYMIVLAEDNTDCATVLGNILFEHKHVYTFTESGLLDVVPYVNSVALSPAGTLTTAPGTRNLRGELVPKKIAEKYDDIRVSYSEVELKTGLVLFQDTDGATSTLPCNIELAAAGDSEGNDYYPKTADDGEVFASWNNPDGYDIWIATSAAMDVTLASGIVVQRALSNYYRKCSFGYRNTAAAVRNITKMRITGNAYVRTSKNTARVAESGASDLFEHDCQYVFSKTAAQALAAALAQYYRYSDLSYTAKSKDLFALGAYITVADPVYSGISTICRVVGLSDSEQQPGLYTYTLEGAADYVSVTIVTEGSATSPSSPNFGGQTPQEVASAIALASITLRLSSSSIQRSRAGALSPSVLTASALNQDGTAYLGRFVVELSHDGETYQTAYTSAADESSYAYTVPATMVVETVTYYVVAVRVSLFAAGGTPTLLGQSLCSVTADPSTAAAYLGIGILSVDTKAFAGATVDENGTITTTGTVSQIYTGDTVVNYSASGGVTTLGVYKWSGTAWVKTTTIKDLTPAMNDLFGLNMAGVTIADATTVSLLIAKQILAENVDVTGQLTVQAGGRMRYETGSGVQKRCVQLADDKVAFIDIPDTSPATPEQLRARIGRIGVGPSILIDGEFYAPISCQAEYQGVVAGVATTDELGSPKAVVYDDGLWVFYRKWATLSIRYKIRTGSSWSSEQTFTPDWTTGARFAVCALSNGDLYAIYSEPTTLGTPSPIHGRRYSAGWGAWENLGISAYNGTTYTDIALIDAGDGVPGIIFTSALNTLSYGEIRSGIVGDLTTVLSTAHTEISTCGSMLEGGGLCVVGTGGYLAFASFINGSFSSFYTTGTAGAQPSIIKNLTGLYGIVFVESSVSLKYIVGNLDSWSAPISVLASEFYFPCIIQSPIGGLEIITLSADLVVESYILERYARIGAGIVANDGDDLTFGDGTVLPIPKEGSWTPYYASASGALGTVVYGAATYGRYKETGGLVNVWGIIRTDSLAIGTAVGAVSILGLPFPVLTYTRAGTIGYSGAFAGDVPSSIIAVGATRSLRPYYRTAVNGNSLSLDASDLMTGSSAGANYIIFAATYEKA